MGSPVMFPIAPLILSHILCPKFNVPKDKGTTFLFTLGVTKYSKFYFILFYFLVGDGQSKMLIAKKINKNRALGGAHN
jgi:hypothetical protein